MRLFALVHLILIHSITGAKPSSLDASSETPIGADDDSGTDLFDPAGTFVLETTDQDLLPFGSWEGATDLLEKTTTEPPDLYSTSGTIFEESDRI